jgi:hypothetical protein
MARSDCIALLLCCSELVSYHLQSQLHLTGDFAGHCSAISLCIPAVLLRYVSAPDSRDTKLPTADSADVALAGTSA